MEESPRKQQSTSRVIDSLHSQIDTLKNELEVLRSSCGDYKKKAAILASKNDSLVDQLANCKHENDMVNALLKRKERRIADLETEFDDLSLESESMKQTMKNYKIRCENLQESSASSTAEFERLKISYDALVAAQGEYKRHYQAELTKLSTQLDTYKLDSSRAMTDLLAKLNTNDKDVGALLEGLNAKRASMDNILVERNKSILALLSLLAKVAKTHGEECQSILLDNVEIINVLRDKIPEVFDRVSEHTPKMISLDDLLHESALSLETSFADLDLRVSGESTRQVSRAASQLSKRRNRNSMRLSPEASTSSQETLPKQRGTSKPQAGRGAENGSLGLRCLLLKRNSSHGLTQNQYARNSSGARQSLVGLLSNSQRGTANPQLRSSSSSNNSLHKTNSNSSLGKNHKRRLFYGGSSNYNMSGGERGLIPKAEDPNHQHRN